MEKQVHQENGSSEEQSVAEPNIYVSITHAPLDSNIALSSVKSPKAGAVVLFAGCTRDTFASKTVTHLSYSTYAPLALRSLLSIAKSTLSTHNLVSIYITHRLGRVDIGEESILIAVSAPHRTAAWRAGEECLERVKARVEIWKEEWFADGGIWRANRDGKEGVPVGKLDGRIEERDVNGDVGGDVGGEM